MSKIDISEHQKIIELYKTKSLKDIGQIYNVHESTISRLLRKYNVARNRVGSRKRKLSEEQEEQIVQLYTQNLLSTSEIAKQYNVGDETIRKTLIRQKVKRRAKSEANIIKTKFSFHNMNKYKSFILGLIYGDGSISIRKDYVNITSGDYDVLEKTQNIIGPKFKIKKVKDKNYHFGVIYSKKIANELLELFQLTNNKSDKLIFPKLDNELYPAFISGYLAADGCISINIKEKRFVLSFYSCSKQYLEDLNELICYNINIKKRNLYHKNKKKSYNDNRFGKKPIYSLTFNGSFGIKACEYIFKDKNNLWCDRKYNNFCIYKKQLC